jgi:poly(3-hydroxybutyrate) depolymerase
VWYNTKYSRSVEKKLKKVTFREVFDKPELDPVQPVRTRILHYYSHHFYEERIKPQFTTRWAAVSRLPNPPAVLALRNLVTREAWAAESEAFQVEVLAAQEAEHTRAMDAYSIVVSAEVPTTAEEYNV